MPFTQRVGRFLETTRLCWALWEPGRVSVTGKYWMLDDVELLPKPHRKGGPPMWMGGSGKTALRSAGTLFDGWFTISPTAEDFRKGWERVRTEARAAGRDPSAVTPALYATVRLDANVDAARETMRRFIEDYYMVPYERIAARQRCYARSVEGCVEWLTGFRQAGTPRTTVSEQSGSMQNCRRSRKSHSGSDLAQRRVGLGAINSNDFLQISDVGSREVDGGFLLREHDLELVPCQVNEHVLHRVG